MKIFHINVLLSNSHLMEFNVASLTKQNATSQVNLSARSIYEEV